MDTGITFMRTEETGTLYLSIDDILLNYIYPRVFACTTDTEGERYLFYEVYAKGSKDIWLVAKIGEEEYRDIVEQKRAIQSAYKNKEDIDVFTITNMRKDYVDNVSVAFDAGKWIERLPDEPVFAENDIGKSAV